MPVRAGMGAEGFPTQACRWAARTPVDNYSLHGYNGKKAMIRKSSAHASAKRGQAVAESRPAAHRVKDARALPH